jgi:hypothetical protein
LLLAESVRCIYGKTFSKFWQLLLPATFSLQLALAVMTALLVTELLLLPLLINLYFIFKEARLISVYLCLWNIPISCLRVTTMSYDSHSGLLTKKFINLIKHAEDGILDLNKAAETLEVTIILFGSTYQLL